jgi:hypothetical protein
MAKLHSNRQMSVASVLLLLLAAFALTPLEYPCHTQSRNRKVRVVRLDDPDTDHNRWSSHDLGNTGNDTHGDSLVVLAAFPEFLPPGLVEFGRVSFPDISNPFTTRSSRLRNRAPPVSS